MRVVLWVRTTVWVCRVGGWVGGRVNVKVDIDIKVDPSLLIVV